MAGAAPAIVKASSLMKIIVPSQDIIVPLNFNNQSVLFNKDIVGRGMTQPIYQVDEQAWSNSELKVVHDTYSHVGSDGKNFYLNGARCSRELVEQYTSGALVDGRPHADFGLLTDGWVRQNKATNKREIVSGSFAPIKQLNRNLL